MGDYTIFLRLSGCLKTIVGWVFNPPRHRRCRYRVGVSAHRNGRKPFRLPER
ncbi:MAG: hypothetical protein J5680_02260 [Neisseriaceae bacterium]|nr:hypothetical protein [Neisseriaceae bacterium]